MTATTAEPLAHDTDAMTIEQLTKEVVFMKKQYNTMHNAVQSLSSQVMRLDRDLRTLSQKKNIH